MVNPVWRWIVSSAIVLGSIAIVLQLQFNTSSEPDYLALLLFFLVGVSVAVFFSCVRPSSHVSVRLLTVRVVRASFGLALVAALLWALSFAVNEKYLPPLPVQWEYLLLLFATIAVLGFGWRARAKKATFDTSKSFKLKDHEKPAWDTLEENLANDTPRKSHLKSLQKIHEAASSAPPEKIKSLVEEELTRMQMEAKSAAKEQEKDMLDGPAAWVEWAVQKLPEIAQLDTTDLRMAKCVHDINSLHSSERNIFVDHRQLLPLHQINRGTANEKCNERAAVAKKAMPLIKENGNCLSEALIQGHEELSAFESVTGIQVISIAAEGQTPEYVTFEGNGRGEALNRAFGGRQAAQGIQVEVREFRFPNEEVRSKIREEVQLVRNLKGAAQKVFEEDESERKKREEEARKTKEKEAKEKEEKAKEAEKAKEKEFKEKEKEQEKARAKEAKEKEAQAKEAEKARAKAAKEQEAKAKEAEKAQMKEAQQEVLAKEAEKAQANIADELQAKEAGKTQASKADEAQTKEGHKDDSKDIENHESKVVMKVKREEEPRSSVAKLTGTNEEQVHMKIANADLENTEQQAVGNQSTEKEGSNINRKEVNDTPKNKNEHVKEHNNSRVEEADDANAGDKTGSGKDSDSSRSVSNAEDTHKSSDNEKSSNSDNDKNSQTEEATDKSKDGKAGNSSDPGTVEWYAYWRAKLPELTQLDLSDLRLVKCVHNIGSYHTTEKNIFVDHRQLLPIHQINRETAIEKCNQRVEVVKNAMHIIKENGNRLSEALIREHKELSGLNSRTGIQVVNIADPGETPQYVMFEGNGRGEALKKAFGGKDAEEGIEVEVCEFGYPDDETRKKINDEIRVVRQVKGADEEVTEAKADNDEKAEQADSVLFKNTDRESAKEGDPPKLTVAGGAVTELVKKVGDVVAEIAEKVSDTVKSIA